MAISIWKGMLAGAAMLASGLPASAQEQVRVHGWADFVNPAVFDAFTRETGIGIVYDPFDNLGAVENRLMSGRSGYDLVMVPATFLPRHVPLNLYAPLDKTKLPNLVHLWPDISSRLAKFDPGNRHAVGYVWGSLGLGYNPKKLREHLGPDASAGSWSILFDPAKLRKLSTCGVQVIDSAEEMFPLALRYLGLDPGSRREADLRKAADLLGRMRPYIRKFHASDQIGGLANGEICLAVTSSFDILQARKRASEARNGMELRYSIPGEGAPMGFDTLVIPADAPNREGAHRLLDFLNRPEVAALNAAFLRHASANLAARKHLPAEMLEDPIIYPPAEAIARLYATPTPDEPTRRNLARLWNRVKTGK